MFLIDKSIRVHRGEEERDESIQAEDREHIKRDNCHPHHRTIILQKKKQ